MIAKKIYVRLLFLLILFASVFYTYKKADAFAPAAAVAYLVASVSSAAGESYALGALAGLVGLTGMYLTIEDAEKNAIAIPLGTKSTNTPSPPVATQLMPLISTSTCVDPSASVTICEYRQGVGYVSGSQPYKVSESASSCTYALDVTVYDSSACSEIKYVQTYNPYTIVTKDTVTSCPEGYTPQGVSCTLVNPRVVTDDKRCDILLTMGQFSTADDLNCSASTDGTKASPLIRDGKVIAYGKNANGDPLVFTVTPDYTVGDKEWISVVTQEQVQTATETLVKTTTILVDPVTSQIASASSSTSPGSISSPTSADTVPTTTDPGVVTSIDNTPKVTVDTTKQPSIVFPDDYAREGTATAIKTSTKSIEDSLKNTSDVIDPAELPSSAFSEPFFKGTFDNLLGWSPPSHSSVCPTSSFNALGQTFTINAHCALMEDNKGPLQTAMSVIYLLSALFIVLKA